MPQFFLITLIVSLLTVSYYSQELSIKSYEELSSNIKASTCSNAITYFEESLNDDNRITNYEEQMVYTKLEKCSLDNFKYHYKNR